MTTVYTKEVSKKSAKKPPNPIRLSKTENLAKHINERVSTSQKNIPSTQSKSSVITTGVDFIKKSSVRQINKKTLDAKSIDDAYTKHLVDDTSIKTADILRARNALKKALIPVLNRMDTIDNRIKFAGIVRLYTQNIETCIKVNIAGVLTLMEKNNAGIVKELIQYDERIGSASQYGIAYRNMGKDLFRKITFASKIMSSILDRNVMTNPKKEIELLQKMSELVENKISPHMPVVYKIVRCTKRFTKLMAEQGIEEYTKPDDIIARGSYYIVLNELASEDMASFLKKPHSDEVYESILMQVFVSIHTFHKYTNHIHNDTHLGNFLIHRIKAGGYWHYTVGNEDMYVPNCGFLVVLWDPGLATKITAYTPKRSKMDDYIKVYEQIYLKSEHCSSSSCSKLIFSPSVLWLFNDFKISIRDNNYQISNLSIGFKHIKIGTQPSVVINDIPYML